MPTGIKIMDHNYTNFMTMNSNPCNVTIIMIIQERERERERDWLDWTVCFPVCVRGKTIQIIKPLRATTVG